MEAWQHVFANLYTKTETMLTREQCRGGRAMLDWSRGDIARESGLSERTITDFERGAREPHDNNKRAMREALERAGLEFIPENGGGAGIRFRERKNAKPDEGLRPDQLTSENDGGAQG